MGLALIATIMLQMIFNIGWAIFIGFNFIAAMFTAIPLHAVCGVILGYYVGLAKFSENTQISLYKGLFLATLVHALYNYFLFAGHGLIMSVIALIVAIYYSKKAIKLHQKDSKLRNS